MSERVFIIHGWGGHRNEAWIPWLKKELESRGYQVFNPAMPNTDHPIIPEWVDFLDKLVGAVNEQTHFVGHSIGCQTIMRYLQKLEDKLHVGNVVFVAGFFNLLDTSYEDESEKEIAKPWLNEPINTHKIKQISSKILAIFSDNDECVPLSDELLFKEKLNAQTLVLKNKGHFSDSDHITEIPEILYLF